VAAKGSRPADTHNTDLKVVNTFTEVVKKIILKTTNLSQQKHGTNLPCKYLALNATVEVTRMPTDRD
jgi:hypothetical protein